MSKALRAEVVADCLRHLRARRIHEHFPGYLCLKQTAAFRKRNDGLVPDFKAFWDRYMRVAGAPARAPYVRAFLQPAPTPLNVWFNENVAGSYAPSSLRGVGAILKVATLDSKFGQWSLHPDHAKLARRHLLNNDPLPILDLVGFLYRNYGLVNESGSAADFVEAFRVEFGYDTTSGNEEFSMLYADRNPGPEIASWLTQAN
jgi:hypothetical protein